MSKERFFCISQSDTAAHVSEIDREEVEEMLNGSEDYLTPRKLIDLKKAGSDPAYWGEHSVFIVRGEPIRVRESRIVTRTVVE